MLRSTASAVKQWWVVVVVRRNQEIVNWAEEVLQPAASDSCRAIGRPRTKWDFDSGLGSEFSTRSTQGCVFQMLSK